MARKIKADNSAEKVLVLKPGNHQFVPGSHAYHNNDNTSSDDLAFYLKAYPHIKGLLETESEQGTAEPDTSSTPDQDTPAEAEL